MLHSVAVGVAAEFDRPIACSTSSAPTKNAPNVHAGAARAAPADVAEPAAEYSANGVRVNAIAPGPVYTPTPSGPEFITALGETTPMHRVSQPEEIAEVVAFLASPRASYITDTTVAADGGRRAI